MGKAPEFHDHRLFTVIAYRNGTEIGRGDVPAFNEADALSVAHTVGRDFGADLFDVDVEWRAEVSNAPRT